jgi:FAD-linked sulfhydryl oxidase
LATTSAAANSAAAATDDDGRLPRDCPADVERLGRHTWTFLHTTASYYPPDPTQQQRTSMLSLLRALPVLYPCHTCADELGSYMKAHPPEKAVEQGRTSLERWLCEVHNEVNVRLGKEEFNCDSVPERWRDGWKDGRCD